MGYYSTHTICLEYNIEVNLIIKNNPDLIDRGYFFVRFFIMDSPANLDGVLRLAPCKCMRLRFFSSRFSALVSALVFLIL